MSDDEKQLAGELLDTAKLARTVSLEALELALKQVREGTVKDPTSTARNAAVVVGIALEKHNLLLDRPTQLIAHETPQAIIARLGRRVGYIDTTATDVTEQPVLESPGTPNPSAAASTTATDSAT